MLAYHFQKGSLFSTVVLTFCWQTFLLKHNKSDNYVGPYVRKLILNFTDKNCLTPCQVRSNWLHVNYCSSRSHLNKVAAKMRALEVLLSASRTSKKSLAFPMFSWDFHMYYNHKSSCNCNEQKPIYINYEWLANWLHWLHAYFIAFWSTKKLKKHQKEIKKH